MIRITEVAFVAYPISDISRARNFYENVLGLSPGDVDNEIEGMPGKQWIEYELGNMTLAISNAWEPSGASGPTVAFELPDLDEAVTQLKQAGVTFVADHMKVRSVTSPSSQILTETASRFTSANRRLFEFLHW
jgi:predicted enzyme related to lactoylglutathione lyase